MCGTEGEIVVAHMAAGREKSYKYVARKGSGGSCPPAFPPLAAKPRASMSDV